MNKYTGVELVNETKVIVPNYRDVETFLQDRSLDYYQYGIVVRTDHEKQELITLLADHQLFETNFTLYKIENAIAKSTFTDFGFVSNENNFYLYEELVIPFTTSGNNERDILAAVEQMDEHLVATATCANQTFYFVERYHQDLIQGIADAYKIIVLFYP